MSRSLALAFVSALLACAAGVNGGDVGTRTPSGLLPIAASTAMASASAPGQAAVRAGRRLSLDAALRELDLIRPGSPKAAQDFTAPLLSGSRFRLADHRGKVVLINFWATWCHPCREEMPALERLWRQHRDVRFLLVAVSLDANRELVKPFVTEHRLTFPIALDSQLEVANLYGIRALPASFIVDRQGQMTALALGPRPWDNDAAHSIVEELMK
jgi:peroxiredoxin